MNTHTIYTNNIKYQKDIIIYSSYSVQYEHIYIYIYIRGERRREREEERLMNQENMQENSLEFSYERTK